MRRIIILFAVIIFPLRIFGQDVSETTASQVALTFMQQILNKTMSVSSIQNNCDEKTGIPCLYFVNFTSGEWCIVPSDKRVFPILAYNVDTTGLSSDAPEELLKTIAYYKQFVLDIIQNNETLHFHYLWEYLIIQSPFVYKPGTSLLDSTGRGVIAWGQCKNNDNTCIPSYNQNCPSNNFCCDHSYAGCGAVAMGQIMWYWMWPKLTLRNVYHWEKMPGKLLSTTPLDQANEIANIISDCGYYSNINYWLSTGSWTVIDNIIDGLSSMGYYGIKKHIKSDWSYSDSWNNLIRSEIDNGRPMIFYGDSWIVFTGHYFIVDGYSEVEDELFVYVNWGHRNNSKKTYCKLDRLVETTSSTSNYYNIHNKAIVGISPTYNENQIINLTYSNVNSSMHRKEYALNTIIIPGESQTINVCPSGLLSLEAGSSIQLRPGFYAERGCYFKANINAEWQSGMAIGVTQWPARYISANQAVNILTHNADSWEFTVYDVTGSIVFRNAGSIKNDTAYVLQSNILDYGNYTAEVAFKNSYGRRLEQQIGFTIVPSSNSQPDNFPNELCIQDSSYISRGDDSTILTAYPNPSEGVFNLHLDNDTIVSLYVSNMQGYCCYINNNVIQQDCIINLVGYPKGQYYVTAASRNRVYTTKLILH